MLREKTGDKHLPDELLQWALDFACEHIEKPTLPQGHHETDNTIRDELIQFVIDMCHMGCSDMTLERTKEEVSNVVHLSYDTIDHIYKEQKRKKAARVKRVDEFIANAENKEIPTDP